MRFQYMNKQIVCGFIGNVPDMRFMTNQDPVLELQVATTHAWKDKADNWRNDTEWHTCVFYRKHAEAAKEALKKGDGVYVEGRAVTRKWTANDGSARQRKEIVVDLWHPVRYDKSENGAPPAPDERDDLPPTSSGPNTAGYDTGN